MDTGGRHDDEETIEEVRRQLRMASRHLRWLQLEHEGTLETLQQERRQRAWMVSRMEALADALAASLSADYWQDREGPAAGPPRGRRRRPQGDEAELVREVESSPLFDGGWYLRTHRRAVRSGLSPALHYVRNGNRKGLDPGPEFSTSAYLDAHPEVAGSGVPALVHATRTGNAGGGGA